MSLLHMRFRQFFNGCVGDFNRREDVEACFKCVHEL